MRNKPAHTIRRLGPLDAALMDPMLDFFGAAFGDPASYTSKRPGAAYLRSLLGGDSFIALAALEGATSRAPCAPTSCASSSRSAARSISTTWRWPRRIGAKESPPR